MILRFFTCRCSGLMHPFFSGKQPRIQKITFPQPCHNSLNIGSVIEPKVLEMAFTYLQPLQSHFHKEGLFARLGEGHTDFEFLWENNVFALNYKYSLDFILYKLYILFIFMDEPKKKPHIRPAETAYGCSPADDPVYEDGMLMEYCCRTYCESPQKRDKDPKFKTLQGERQKMKRTPK